MANPTLAELLNFQKAVETVSAPEATAAAKPSQNEMIAQAILGLAPILAGAALGGARGGAIGAEAGLTGLKTLEAQKEKAKEAAKKDAEAKLTQIKTALELSKEQRAEEAAQRAAGRETEKLGIEKRKLELEEKKVLSDVGASEKQLKKLPVDNQLLVDKLGKDSASKVAIANEIAQTVALFDDPKVSDDQKIKSGQALLKVLNSTQGSDAVGVEEARRLGSLLEFQVFNFTQPGPVFGRDLKEFRNQAANTVNRLSGAVDANKISIQKAMSGEAVSIPRIEMAPSEPSIVSKMLPSGLSGKDAVAAPMTERQKRIMELRNQLGK
jgi:hypothetical protein